MSKAVPRVFHAVPWNRLTNNKAFTSGGLILFQTFWVGVKTSVLAMVHFLGEASNEIMVSVEFREVLTLQKKKSFKHTHRDRDTHTQTHTLHLCPCYIVTLLG